VEACKGDGKRGGGLRQSHTHLADALKLNPS